MLVSLARARARARALSLSLSLCGATGPVPVGVGSGALVQRVLAAGCQGRARACERRLEAAHVDEL